MRGKPSVLLARRKRVRKTQELLDQTLKTFYQT